jgi:hypothetical protein
LADQEHCGLTGRNAGQDPIVRAAAKKLPRSEPIRPSFLIRRVVKAGCRTMGLASIQSTDFEVSIVGGTIMPADVIL